MVISQVLFLTLALIIGLAFIGLVFARLYKRASKERAFVRTGAGGQKVILDGGCLVIPVLHEIIYVNRNTLKLEVSRANEQALITNDRMRVDVTAEFYVSVGETVDAISAAAKALGQKTHNPSELREATDGKFVDALRAVAAEMTMEQLHEKRSDFVQRVLNAVAEDLKKDGLILQAVSLTRLDQTDISFLNPQNSFDAEGLTKLTEITETRKKKRNEIEQDTRIQIDAKNLESDRMSYEIERDREFAKLDQEREVANRRAEQQALIAKNESERKLESEKVRIATELKISQDTIAKEKAIKEAEIAKEQAESIALQNKDIALSQKSQEESEASRLADEARVSAVKAREDVTTAQHAAQAERTKMIELIEASKVAEKSAVGVRVQAQVELESAENRAKAIVVEAQAKRDAEQFIAEGKTAIFEADANGERLLNEARNTLQADQINMLVRMELIKNLAGIIEAAARPAEKIDSIKLISMNGVPNPLGGGNGAVSGGNGTSGSGSLSDQVVDSVLKMRTMAPVVDQLVSTLGIDPNSLQGMTGFLNTPVTSSEVGETLQEVSVGELENASPWPNSSHPVETIGDAESN